MTLETGWLPDTPDDDTIERQAVLAMASRVVAVAQAAGAPWIDDHRVAVARLHARSAFANLGVAKCPIDDPAGLVADVTTALDGAPFALLTPWAPPPGPLEIGGHPPFMVRWPGEGDPAAPGDGVSVWEAHDSDQLAVAERLLVDGYPMPDLADFSSGMLFPPGLLGGRERFFVAEVDGEAAAVAAVHVDHGVNLVEFVATVEKHRGKGLGALVTGHASVSDPSLPAVLQSSDLGRRVYEGIGYRSLRRWTFCSTS